MTETVFPIARFVEAPLHRLLLSTGETHVAGERKLAADARRPPANARDRNDRSATQPHKHVRKLLQARGTRRKSRSVLGLREEVVVCQEESIDGTVKHDNLDLLVSLERRDGLVELGGSFPGRRC